MDITFDFEQPIVELDKRIEEMKKSSPEQGIDLRKQIKNLEKTRDELKQKIYDSLSPWQYVQIARHPQRPYFEDYIKLIFKNFVELHGDRCFGDDRAILCGIAKFDDKPITVIGHQKGRSLEKNLDKNFGMAHPEGYRKALRVMKLSEKFNRPIITFVDTPGAYPGIAAEERGQAQAIATNLREMSNIRVPIITVVIGEGGSGGALGIAVSNKVLCLENSYYSVISPEGCAAILFKNDLKTDDLKTDDLKTVRATNALKLTSKDLLKLKVIDEIIKEPLGGAHYNHNETAVNVKIALSKNLHAYDTMSYKKIVQERYLKFRNFGIYEEGSNRENNKK